MEITVNLDYSRAKGPLYVQLYNFIKEEIISGRLEPHIKLPSIRELAAFHSMSKITVETAYNQLLVEGYISSRPKSGYFVNPIEEIIKIEKLDADKSDKDRFNKYKYNIDKIDIDKINIDKMDIIRKNDFIKNREIYAKNIYDMKIYNKTKDKVVSKPTNKVIEKELLEGELIEKELIGKVLLEKEIAEKELTAKNVVQTGLLSKQVVQKEIINKEINEKEAIEKEAINKQIVNKQIRIEKETEVEYDFTNEFLDKESFDFQLWKKYINKALRYNDVYLSYGSCLGEYILRREIARYIGHSRGVICSPDQIIVGAGVQAVLSILCAVLKPKYDSIVFEEPGFTKGQYVFKDHGFKIVPVSVEDDGINVRHLAGNGGKVVYVSPSHQYPTGSVMSINKRTQLLNWANASNGIIIEDDYDSELRYFGRPIPSLQGLNKGNGIVYLGSFSKIMLPSIRISFMVLPVNLLEETADILNRYNQTSSKIEQVALALFMKEGLLEKHIRKLRKIYARKNQLFTNSINSIMKNRVKIMGKETGLYVLLGINSSRSMGELVSLAARVGIRVVPITGYLVGPEEEKLPHVLLSYGGIPANQIEPAIDLLNKIWFG